MVRIKRAAADGTPIRRLRRGRLVGTRRCWQRSEWWWRDMDSRPNTRTTKEVMQANGITVVKIAIAAVESAALLSSASVLRRGGCKRLAVVKITNIEMQEEKARENAAYRCSYTRAPRKLASTKWWALRGYKLAVAAIKVAALGIATGFLNE